MASSNSLGDESRNRKYPRTASDDFSSAAMLVKLAGSSVDMVSLTADRTPSSGSEASVTSASTISSLDSGSMPLAAAIFTGRGSSPVFNASRMLGIAILRGSKPALLILQNRSVQGTRGDYRVIPDFLYDSRGFCKKRYPGRRSDRSNSPG